MTILLDAEFATRVRNTVHTDSYTAHSIATRHGTTNVARHIQRRFVFLQDPVSTGSIHIRNIAGTYIPVATLKMLVAADTLQRLLPIFGLVQVPHCIANLYIGSKYKGHKENEPPTHQKLRRHDHRLHQEDTTKNTYLIGCITNHDDINASTVEESTLKPSTHRPPLHSLHTTAMAAHIPEATIGTTAGATYGDLYSRSTSI